MCPRLKVQEANNLSIPLEQCCMEYHNGEFCKGFMMPVAAVQTKEYKSLSVIYASMPLRGGRESK